MRRTTRLLAGLALAVTSVNVSFVTMTATATAEQATPTCDGLAATIVGTTGADVLDGTAGNDVIVGLSGSDRIRGGEGDDVICGGSESDKLRGGRGDDRLYGQRDLLFLHESFPGGAVYYMLWGDRLMGGPGEDYLDAGRDPRPDQVYEPDAVLFGGGHGVEVRLAASGHRGSAVGEGHDVIVGQPGLAVTGSPGPDRIWGSPMADDLSGGGGDDVIRGLGGNDILIDGVSKDSPDRDVLLGGAGADTLETGFGADVVDGGPGADSISTSDWRVKAMRGRAGNDTFYYPLAGWGCPVFDGGDGSDTLSTVTGRKRDNATIRIVLDGDFSGCGHITRVDNLRLEGASRWEVVGTNRPDSLYVESSIPVTAHLRGGDDRATGGEGDDVLVGGPGNDHVDGWLGEDTCRGFETVENCERT